MGCKLQRGDGGRSRRFALSPCCRVDGGRGTSGVAADLAYADRAFDANEGLSGEDNAAEQCRCQSTLWHGKRWKQGKQNAVAEPALLEGQNFDLGAIEASEVLEKLIFRVHQLQS